MRWGEGCTGEVRIEREKKGITLMFLAAYQLRSQGYPGFPNSHGKGGVLRAGGRDGVRAGGETEEGEKPALFLLEGGCCSEGESNPQTRLYDKLALAQVGGGGE